MWTARSSHYTAPVEGAYAARALKADLYTVLFLNKVYEFGWSAPYFVNLKPLLNLKSFVRAKNWSLMFRYAHETEARIHEILS